jgi:hypothetical protein
MFGTTKKTMNATCVMPLNEANVAVLKAMQMNHPIPEEAKYIAFLEDGDACFLESIERGPFSINIPQMHMITYYTDIQVVIEE